MEAVVAPLLHNIVPPDGIDKTLLPQLFTTDTTGVAVLLGAATPDPAALVQPLIVDVTVYVPAPVTIIDELEEPVLHNKFPPAFVDRIEVPSQLLTIVTTGVAGAVPGAATPEPAALVQPFTV